MSSSFVFIGDPGTDAKDKLSILESLDVAARRVPDPSDVDAIEAMAPQGIVISEDFPDLGPYIVSLRERRALSRVPIVGRVSTVGSGSVEHAFRSGCDDIIVDGRINQFRAMASSVTQNEDLHSMRAPAGLVVLAHQDRYTRMRIGQVLRKNGFDMHFAGTSEELVNVIEEKKPRAVITAYDLPPRSPISYMESMEHQVPWIVLTAAEQMAILENAVGGREDVKFLEHSSDAESLTFVLNDFLAPKQKSERRTPRILYGTTVSFRPEASDGNEEFYGFSYNVNIGGLFVRTLTPPPMQSLLLVTFQPPMGLGKVALTAQVVWRKTMGTDSGPATPEGMGVQFVDSMPADTAGFEAGYNCLREQHDRRKTSYTSVVPAQTFTPTNVTS
ncbi:MAG: PilZ domain-containing protein [Deltaproteobacteria bacterium]|nr:PilZ domain-containing protein [Deltaproteobacteria bacterium]MBN2674290.1 PilZ domain-containing protein [Deltaproteobacteria bacterium]